MANMVQQQHSTIEKATSSEGAKMPDIKSLVLRVQDLSHSVEFWNTLMIWALVFTAIAAVAVVATTRLVVLRSGQLGEAQEEVSKAKELEMSIALDQAIKEAGHANERAGNLEKEASVLTAKNLQLEATIAPRRLSDKQQKGLAGLVGFAGRTVEIKSHSLDTEGFVLAQQIGEAIGSSKIRILDNRGTMLPGGSILTGIVIEGPDAALVEKLRSILAANGGTMGKSLPNAIPRGGFGGSTLGEIIIEPPPGAIITVGIKPLR